MYFFLFLILCAALVLLILQQQGKLPLAKKKSELPSVERNIFNLEIGDIVQYEGVDWFVEGKLVYNIGSYNWFEYMLQKSDIAESDALSDHICWLSVEEDDLVEVSIFKNVDIPPEINSASLPETLTYLEVDYHLAESGTAKMLRLGNTLNRQAQTCNYYDYKSSDNLRLSVEVWDQDIEVTVGQKINPRILNFLPGDRQQVFQV